MSDSEMSPASKTSDVERVVMPEVWIAVSVMPPQDGEQVGVLGNDCFGEWQTDAIWADYKRPETVPGKKKGRWLNAQTRKPLEDQAVLCWRRNLTGA